MAELNFYKKPFTIIEGDNWVYDNIRNFVFQFDGVSEELKQQVLDSLNSDKAIPIKQLNLSFLAPIEILNNQKPFITIRGWGNLTGDGAHNFPPQKAQKIQDDFRIWLLEKLTTNN